ncbi:hypothetical protein J2W25_005167 [Variovorax boronicumulans]|uniref:Uncharacterized protein n=1 Tax=Variovorax boronicumulans TaxID=436515 RepID=A0AAW8E3C7_9BURK|nr:hypothetical protein [Variovorax boronicumulans]MDP9881105.1 hypothetical protein [Variovorax boronicumulans]MDP9926120.1 hypothetical protein [Variovorax boronicumulans]
MFNFFHSREYIYRSHRTGTQPPECYTPKVAAATPLIAAATLLRIGVGVVAAMLAFTAPAAQGQWAQGFGQGNLEYFIDAQGMRLLIGCPTPEGSADAASSVTLMAVASSQEVKKFTVKVGGHTFEGPFEADSRVGENNFITLLNDLRKGDALVSYGGKTVIFAKSNAAQVLPAYGKRGFQCNLG